MCNNWNFKINFDSRKPKQNSTPALYGWKCDPAYLSIILSNFQAFKNRKLMMKFLVGSYTLKLFISWAPGDFYPMVDMF